MFKEFQAFIARGNVVDVAVAVIIAAAFGKIVTTFVEGVVMPPIGMLTGGIDFSSLFYALDTSKGIPGSLVDAKAKGIPVIAYGQFINDVINFLIVAAAIFLAVKQTNRLKSPPVAPATKECPECLSKIPVMATRCANCTVELKVA